MTAACSYQHRAWSASCGKPEEHPVHYAPNGELRPPWGAYSGPVRHPFNAPASWSPWGSGGGNAPRLPDTEAGMALLRTLTDQAGVPAERLLREQILAIEAEARAS